MRQLFDLLSQDLLLSPRARRFARSERGTIAVLFALLLVPILGIVFGGIDYSRALSLQGELQSAAEAATVSAAHRLREGKPKAEAAFKAAFRTNLPDHLKDLPYELSIAGDATMLKVEIAASVPTTLVGILGVSELEVAAAASAARPEPEFLARRKRGSAGEPFGPPADTAEAARARAELDRAIRSGGLRVPKMPAPEEMDKARRQMRGAMRAMGAGGHIPKQQEVPDAAEIQRMHDRIVRELSRLRF